MSCGDDDDSGDASPTSTSANQRLTVGAAFYPIEEIIRRVGGDAIDVVTVVPPGEEAHEYEPTGQQVAELQSADIVFYLGSDFQPSVQDTVDALPSSAQRIDLLSGLTIVPVTAQLEGTEGETDGETLGDGNDPHVWLDPSNVQSMANVVAATLSSADPTAEATYSANRDAYLADLQALDTRFSDGLADCASTVIVTSHRAFEYLARAYGLTQIPIAGISPEDEPSAKSLEAVAEAAKANGVTTIFFEENLPADLSETVADEIGADTSVLDPVESLSGEQLDAGDTYFTVMEQNLESLRTGLGCN